MNSHILYLDCEGAELLCLKDMISRPKLIFVEMKASTHMNPFTKEILAWMEETRYAFVKQIEYDFVFKRM